MTKHLHTLYTADEIARRVETLGRQITVFYREKPLTVITLMTGAICFAADLIREIRLPLWLDSLAVASYADCRSSGKVEQRSRLKLDPAGRHILLLDEVLDTGVTLKCVARLLEQQGAASVRTAVLVEKELERPEGLLHADWTGFVSPPDYLVGYGLDADEEYRNLPYIAVLKRDS